MDNYGGNDMFCQAVLIPFELKLNADLVVTTS